MNKRKPKGEDWRYEQVVQERWDRMGRNNVHSWVNQHAAQLIVDPKFQRVIEAHEVVDGQDKPAHNDGCGEDEDGRDFLVLAPAKRGQNQERDNAQIRPASRRHAETQSR